MNLCHYVNSKVGVSGHFLFSFLSSLWPFFPRQRLSFNISCMFVLVVMNSFSICLSGKLYLSLYCEWQPCWTMCSWLHIIPFKMNTCCYSLLACQVSVDRLAVNLSCLPCRIRTLSPTCYFQDSFLVYVFCELDYDTP